MACLSGSNFGDAVDKIRCGDQKDDVENPMRDYSAAGHEMVADHNF